jgi:hypothetical protein
LEIEARCVRVIDGDTICIVMRHHGEWQWHIRIAGINCPELRGAKVTEREKVKARQVKAYVEKLVLNRFVRLRFGPAEKYGRWLANVQTEGGSDLGSHLLERHMAVPYNGEKKPAYDIEYYEGHDAGLNPAISTSQRPAATEYDADIDEKDTDDERKLLAAARPNARPKRTKRQPKFHFE